MDRLHPVVAGLSTTSRASAIQGCETCVVRRWSLCRPLSHDELSELARVRTGTRVLGPGSSVIEGGEEADALFVIENGWAFSHAITADGRRQILEFHLPGDMLGIEAVGRVEAPHGVETITEVALCVLPRPRLETLMRREATLAFSFACVVSRDRAMLAERLASLGRRAASARVAHLLLELHARLMQRGMAEHDNCALPLKQAHIADAVGLTVEHTNRALAELRREGLATLRDGRLTLHDRRALIELSGWDDAYLKSARLP